MANDFQLVGVKCTTVNIGQAPVITITNSVSAITHWTLTWEFGSQSGTIATRTQQKLFNDYVWSTYFYNEIPNATKGTGVLLLDCYYSNGTLAGTVATPFTVLVNASLNAPTVSIPSIEDTNSDTTALTGSNTKFIRNASTAKVTIRAEAKNGASITSINVVNGSHSFTGAQGFFTRLESPRFTVRVTDSRGLSTTINYELDAEDFIQYTRLTCNLGNDRPDTDGNMTLTCSGNCYFGNFSAAIGNTLAVEYRYKVQGGTYSAWRPMDITSTTESTYRAAASLSGLDYQTTYVFECRASDEVMQISSEGLPVQSLPIFHWSKDDFVFEVPVTFKQGATGIEGGGSSDTGGDQTITGNQTITGDLRLKGSGNYGNTLYFGDGSYCYLKEVTDDDLTIKASDLNLEVTNLYLNGGAIKAGTWTPTLTNSSAVSSYSTRSGWYIRVGNVVTIGFNIGASCYSGYNSSTLAISGLPFTPAANAFGGGVMFGAYVNAGFCFEAWAATTGGQITPRLQPCNNTSAGNLQIASSAYYPSGANTLTLGGTITYITN